MDWTEPATAVMAHGTAAVLRALAGAEGPFGIRELARLASLSPNRAGQVVAKLAAHGIVTVDSRPGTRRVRLNRDHLATAPAVMLADLRSQVLARLRREVSSWPRPALHVSLFGSAARGDGTPESDLDLLAVHPSFGGQADQDAWDDQLARSGELIRRWTGNWVGWFQASPADLRRLASSNDPIVAEWRRDAITLCGSPLITLLAKAP